MLGLEVDVVSIVVDTAILKLVLKEILESNSTIRVYLLLILELSKSSELIFQKLLFILLKVVFKC